jgi:hypothetical protein
MELTWFDFGGQEVFYPTHQFFLTPQCVYLVVFRLNESDYLERVQYWLNTIATFARNASRPTRVIVVGTYADAVSSAEARARIWTQLTPVTEANGSVCARIAVSCATGFGFAELKDAISAAIEGAKLCKPVPQHYLRVWQWIREHRSPPHLKWSIFRPIWPDLVDFQVEGACRFLADMGHCFYSSPEELGLLVMDIQWLADLFKAIISFFTGVRDGLFTRSGLAQTWRSATPEEILEYMALLEKFEMAFLRLSGVEWIMPSMLPEKRPGGSSFPTAALRVFGVSMMPSGIIGRFMVRAAELPRVKFVTMWREGVVERDGELVEVTLDRPLSRMVVRCGFKQAGCIGGHALMQLVTEQCTALLQAIFSRVSGDTPYTESVGCLHCVSIATPLLLSKRQVVDIVLSNAATFLCEGTPVDVRLLDSDITFSYVRLFSAQEVLLDPRPFASGAFGVI